MKASASVKIVDRKAYASSVREVFGDRAASVRVGVLAERGAMPHEAGAGSKISKVPTVVEIAAIHEFGLGVPERSFVRAYIDENEGRIRQMLLALMRGAIERALTQGRAGKIDDTARRGVLSKLGMKMVGEIQQRISRGIAPALAESTIARKGSSTPLIDTGQLRSSITFAIDIDGKGTS